MVHTTGLTEIRPHPDQIRRSWRTFHDRQPGLFAADIAREIGVTEGELMAARIGEGVTRLRPDWQPLLSALPRLGLVKAVTRNRCAVLERDGVYPEFQHFGGHAMFVGDAINLRMSLGFWLGAFAVVKQGRERGTSSRSLQFYGRDGIATHKIYLRKTSAIEEFEAIAEALVDRDQSDRFPLDAGAAGRRTRLRGEVDREELLNDWAALRDTHEFFGLLHKHQVSRTDAFTLAEGRFARRVAVLSARRLITAAAAREIPVMVFAGNHGCIQIHKGLLKKVVDWNGWLNVMDPGSEFHLREDRIAKAWVVEKPTVDGLVASLELFDQDGGDIASFFGIRKEGRKQEERWYEALGEL